MARRNDVDTDQFPRSITGQLEPGREVRSRCLATGEVKRKQATLGGDLADMRVVDDDEIVALGEFDDGERLEILQGPLVP